MTYVVYELSNSAIVSYNHVEFYKTEKAAKAAKTRLVNRKGYKSDDLAVSEFDYYRKNIEQTVERVNLMTGKTYRESINTPLACSPASETYWSS